MLAVVREAGPIASALLIAGAGGSAIAADFGARRIREELDAMEVLGVDPIQRLVVPRVLACMLVAVFLNGLVTVVGVAGGYVFNVVLQDVTPGAYLASFTALAQLPDMFGMVKAVIFGFLAAIVASYKGMNAKGGPKGVGDAVNAGRRHHVHPAVHRQLLHHGDLHPARAAEGDVTMSDKTALSAVTSIPAKVNGFLDDLGRQMLLLHPGRSPRSRARSSTTARRSSGCSPRSRSARARSRSSAAWSA